MRQSKLFTKTLKEIPKEETSVNSKLLIRGGFIDKLHAGVYSYLPLGFRALENIKKIVREEMNQTGAEEILLPAIHPKEIWQTTGRWEEGKGIMFQFKGHGGKEVGLGWTHEEVVTPLAKKFIKSYRDLPRSVFQIQDKFRNEPRAKAGLLRGREFSMKDMYSFHASAADLDSYYEKVKEAYLKTFQRLGLEALLVEASGGLFSKYSHEFQVVTPNGEDLIYFCPKCGRHQNKEITAEKKCPSCGAPREIKKSIEVGNIFKLQDRYSKDFRLTYLDEKGQEKNVLMGCYGLGPSRLLGAIVEIFHDDEGIIWPKEVAPAKIHLLALDLKDQEVKQSAERLYKLLGKSFDVLYDDRVNVSAGVKFSDADLIGLPQRVLVSKRTLEKNCLELKTRSSKESQLKPENEIFRQIEAFYSK